MLALEAPRARMESGAPDRAEGRTFYIATALLLAGAVVLATVAVAGSILAMCLMVGGS